MSGKRGNQAQQHEWNCADARIARMSDPLSFPYNKRAGGRVSLFDRSERPWTFWTMVAILIGLNGWFDYYHPLGLLFDIIIVIALVVVWARQS